MSWNYRVVRYVANGETLYGLMEAYYDEEGKPNGYCAATVTDWESLDDLRGTLEQMLRGCSAQIIEVDGDIVRDHREETEH